jgi:hypothetical protein
MSAAASKGFTLIPTAHRRVLLSAWQANRTRGSMWYFGFLGLVLASVAVWAWWPSPGQSPQGSVFTAMITTIFSALAISPIVLVWAWAKLVYNVLLQNHPHMARLLPAQVPVLRNTLLGTAALLCAVPTLLSWVFGGPVLAIAAGLALGLASVALCVRWVWLWPLCVTLGFTLKRMAANGDLDGAAVLWRTAPEALTLVALVLSALGLRAVVMTGDYRHERAHARLKVMSAAKRGQVPGTSSPSFGGMVGWAMKRGDSAYAAWMDRVLAQVHPTVGARLALGLGPQTHWTGVVAGQVQGLVWVALALLVIVLFPKWNLGHTFASWLMIGAIMSGLAVTVGQLPTALWATRREQSLLRLLPGTPRGAYLNHWLARRLAGVHLAVLTVQGMLLAILNNFVTSDVFGGQAFELALSGLVVGMSLCLTHWRNWAATKAPTGDAQGMLMLAMFLVGGLSAAWVLWLERPWYELAALTLLLTLPLGWWRWRVISRAPSAWPVGRLG